MLFVRAKVTGTVPIPVYTDGEQKNWALDRYGKQLRVPIGCTVDIPDFSQSIDSVTLKKWISFKNNGKDRWYIRCINLQGSDVLLGAPSQETWIEASHLVISVEESEPVSKIKKYKIVVLGTTLEFTVEEVVE